MMAWDCHPLDAPPRPTEGGIALERVPGEAEEAEGEHEAGQEHDGYITVDGVKPGRASEV